jgi:exopolysaccharide biosynthesis WecB/TagA/CpsF family protein
MPFILIIAALVAIVWGAVAARRGSIVIGCAIYVVVAYVFGADFWHLRVGPLPLTLDRLMLVGLLGAFVMQWRMGRLQFRPFAGADYFVAGLTVLLVVSTGLAGESEYAINPQSAWGRLVTAFVLPAVLYLIIRQAPFSQRAWFGLLGCFGLLGLYLAGTALAESAQWWSLVFPRYIADPALGIHYGRARGPGLNSASLGMYLTASAGCVWLLFPYAQQRWHQLAILFAVPLMAGGILATYTRSTWLGFATAALVIAAFQIPRRLRLPATAAAGLAGLLVLGVAWSDLMRLKREGTEGDAEHSVSQRASFAYVSWQMFKDRPLAGVGFGRFYDQKLPYLSDRTPAFELESIRPLHHHNTFLSILVETGVVGFSAFAALLIAWARESWRLAAGRGNVRDALSRSVGILCLALLANYLCSATFHDLSLVPAQHTLLYLFAAIAVNVRQTGFSVARESASGDTAPFRKRPRRVRTEAPTNPASIQLFGMMLSRVTMSETVERVLAWCAEPRGAECRYVVTPNVDHAVMYQQRSDLRNAYADASLVLADGAPIVIASRMLRRGGIDRSLPERVAGSDLVPRLFASVDQTLRVFLLGAAPGVAAKAAERIERQWGRVNVVGTYSPPLGFENDELENAKILAIIASAQPDLLVVGLGAPKQELWVHRHYRALGAKVALCVGATIDFLAGEKQRSPAWMRRAGLEWAHRVISEPRRLSGRYARDAWVFPRLVLKELVNR